MSYYLFRNEEGVIFGNITILFECWSRQSERKLLSFVSSKADGKLRGIIFAELVQCCDATQFYGICLK